MMRFLVTGAWESWLVEGGEIVEEIMVNAQKGYQRMHFNKVFSCYSKRAMKRLLC